MKKIVMFFLVLLVISIPNVAAHPFTEKTVPDLSANAPAGMTRVIVYFSEPVEISFSTIKVIDSDGNQIDNKDTNYHQGESSLVITTPPLNDGVYTVTTKVLSKVDGHLVPNAFLFGVGDVKVASSDSIKVETELIYLPEASARFPGLVGQTIVLGAAIASLMIWGTQGKKLIKEEIDKIENLHHGKFMSITGIGLMLVFISDILMIVIQTIRLETTFFEVVQTYFGTVWLVRVIITIILFGIWFAMNRKKILSKKIQIPMLVTSLVLIATTSMIGHGAASDQMPAIILDYVHNLVAAVWIGGIFYFAFVLLPALSHLKETNKEKMSLVLIPRFSIAFIISIGIVIITGPILLWFLESDIELITESVFGQLIILKILIAVAMVSLGGFLQLKIQKNAERNFAKISIHKRMKKSLRVDAALGIILLGVVALLTNGTLPAGEIQKVDALTTYGFKTLEFTENTKIGIDILPFASGTNTITIKVSDFEGMPLADSDQIKVKLSNPSKNISPIQVPMSLTMQDGGMPVEFQGQLVFGFSGDWQLEIEIQRKETANESTILNLLVKPKLANIQTQITEYDLPEKSNPLSMLYDGKKSIWISDAASPRLWQFSLDTQEFSSYSFDGIGTTFLTKDHKGNIWFTDTPRNQIGYIDPKNKEITTRTIPKLDPVIEDNIPTFIQADFEGNIWISIINKDKILKYTPEQDVFDEINIPDKQSLPAALTVDEDGNIWFVAAGTGKVGYINTQSNKITQFASKTPLESPEYLIFDKNGNLWISEHLGVAITKFNPILETFERIPVINQDALPFGMTFDRYGNILFAQHVVDSIGMYDPDNEELIEIPIPTSESWVQFLTTDGDFNVWFAEYQTNKIGSIKIQSTPNVQIQKIDSKLEYTEIASPLIAAGILITSLMYVKAIRDKQRLNELITS